MKNVEMNGKREGVTVKQGPEELKASTAPVEKEPKGPEALSQTTAKTSLKDNKRLLVLAVGAVVFMLILVGRGNLNQPLSEGDLLRERVSNNIGQASDQAVANLTITQRIVISVPAGTELYVVLQKAAKERVATAEDKAQEKPGIGSTSLQELRQLLQLQRELNQSVTLPGSNQ